GVPFMKPSARSSGRHAVQLAERCIYLDQLLRYPGAPGADIVRPGCEEKTIGLVLDLLSNGRSAIRGPENVGFDEAIGAQPGDRRAHVLGPLMGQEIGEGRFVRGFLPPRPGQHLDLGPRQARRAPGGHVAVVTHLPQPEDRGVELSERSWRWVIAAIPEGEGSVLPGGRLGSLRGG